MGKSTRVYKNLEMVAAFIDICYMLEVSVRADDGCFGIRYSKRFTEINGFFRDLFISKKAIKEQAKKAITENGWWWILEHRFAPIRLRIFSGWRYLHRRKKKKR